MTYHTLPTSAPQRDDYSGFVLGLLAGAAVGGGLALLFAPQEGAQTRQGLASGAQEAGKRVSQAYGSLAGTARRNARRFVGHEGGLGHQSGFGRDTGLGHESLGQSSLGAADRTNEGGSSTADHDRVRPSSEVLRDLVGEASYTPAATPATTSGPGATSPAPDDSRSPLV